MELCFCTVMCLSVFAVGSMNKEMLNVNRDSPKSRSAVLRVSSLSCCWLFSLFMLARKALNVSKERRLLAALRLPQNCMYPFVSFQIYYKVLDYNHPDNRCCCASYLKKARPSALADGSS